MAPMGMVVPAPSLVRISSSIRARFPYGRIALIVIGASVSARPQHRSFATHGRAFLAIQDERACRTRALWESISTHYKTMSLLRSAPSTPACPAGCSRALAQFVNPDAFVFHRTRYSTSRWPSSAVSATLSGAAIGGPAADGAARAPARGRGVQGFSHRSPAALAAHFSADRRGRTGSATHPTCQAHVSPPAPASPAQAVAVAASPAAGNDTGAALLTIDNVGIQFGGLRALQDISLEVGTKDIVSVIGPNGAGKTTLFNLVSGIDRPSSGRILFLGEDITHLPAHTRAACGIGRTFQDVRSVRLDERSR